MDLVRIGIIGMGNMGTGHAKYLGSGLVEGAVLAAVCDERTDHQNKVLEQLKLKDVQTFSDPKSMMASGAIDAVLICTPHYSHPELAIMGFEHGLHVLIEKPAGVYTRQVREMNEASAKTDRLFGIMYNQRTNPMYQKLRELVQSGELGEIRRANWIITDWYRSQSYYNSGGWRATWAGEGGGVLINQVPHQLDLWQWTMGMMPTRVRAFCSFGKHRDIEVENEVTAYAEYANGASAVFITSTCEAPGTNRFEVTGDRGKIVIENGKMKFWRLRVSETEFNATFTGGFGQPECWECDIPVKSGEGNQHMGITQDFVNAIRNGTPLLAPGVEGIHGLTLSNAMLLSSWTDDWATLPLDEERFYALLQERIQNSKAVKA